MFRRFCLPLTLFIAACGGDTGAGVATAEQASGAEEAVVAVELCTIMRGEHIDAPSGGNQSTSSSNGVTISVMGSKSQSISTRDGKAEVTVTGAAVVNLTFPDDEKVGIQINPDAELVRLTIDGSNSINCQAVV
ncbi:MAG: hypothetical protein AAF583_14375 [Pseudomonadota bacterium]